MDKYERDLKITFIRNWLRDCLSTVNANDPEDNVTGATITDRQVELIDAIVRGENCETCDSNERGSCYCLLHSRNYVDHICSDYEKRKEDA